MSEEQNNKEQQSTPPPEKRKPNIEPIRLLDFVKDSILKKYGK